MYDIFIYKFIPDTFQNIFFASAEYEDSIKDDNHFEKIINSDPNSPFRQKFKCSFCNKCFWQLSHIRQHVRIHTGERPYVCLVCNKGFTQKGRLTIHCRTHTGEKPFKCKMCSYSSNESFALKKHFATKHRDCKDSLSN